MNANEKNGRPNCPPQSDNGTPVPSGPVEANQTEKLLPETEQLISLLAERSGNQLEMVEEGARADVHAAQNGQRAEVEQKVAATRRRKEAAKTSLRESLRLLKNTEPKIRTGQRIPMGFLNSVLLVLAIVALGVIIWVENTGTAQTLVGLGASSSLGRARMLLAIPIAMGLAGVLVYNTLPHYVRPKLVLVACIVLAACFALWAPSFAREVMRFHLAASQAITLSEESPGDMVEADGSKGHSSTWLMLGCGVTMIMLTTFVGHVGVACHIARHDRLVTNPDHTRALDDVQAYEHELAEVEHQEAVFAGRLDKFIAVEEQAVVQSRARYKGLKKIANLTVAVVASAVLGAGCGESGNGKMEQHIVANKLTEDGKHKPVTRVVAVSPVLQAAEKTVVKQQLEFEFALLANEAPVGSITLIVNGLTCEPIARLEAVDGGAPIRRAALKKPAIAIREFLNRAYPNLKDDGRVHLPRLTQNAKQWNLPTGTHVVVLGSPLYLNDGQDSFFSMRDGRVPSDGCLFEPAQMNLYSVAGREKSLAGQCWHLGWSDDGVFEDDSHRQAVLRFWSLYFQGQSGLLVSAQPSFVAAMEAARERTTNPLMYADPDRKVAPAMVRIVKVHRHEVNEIESKTLDSAKREADAQRAAREADAAAKAEQDEREAAMARRELKARNELTRVEAKKPVLDQQGNLKGSHQDLVHDNQMKGQRILLITFYRDDDIDGSPLVDALKTKGFAVTRIDHPLPTLRQFETMLDQMNQVWIWSSAERGRLSQGHVSAIVRRWKRGRLSLCLLADNSPFGVEASLLLSAITPGATIQGDYAGRQILHARFGEGSGFDPKSPLFFNITNLYEGVTISSIRGPGLLPVCHASNGLPLIATFQVDGSSRLVVHGGFTSFLREFWSEAGASRFAVNCAGWLSGAEAKPRESSQQ